MIRDDLIARIDTCSGKSSADLADAIVKLLDEKDYHGVTDCPECEVPHWETSNEAQVARLSEAVRMLHTQTHNTPTDTFSAERCHREPCSTVGGGLVVDSDARVAFTPGSRVA